MVRMRDKQTRVVRDVPQQTLDRWPDDYEPVDPKPAKAPKPKRKAPRRPATTTTTRATPPASPVPAEGTDTKGEVA